MRNPLDFSLADFFFNDNPDVLSPPEDFEAWINQPEVKSSFRFFEQPFLKAPSAESEIFSSLDGRRRNIINLTSYNYLGLATHPEVIEAASEAMRKYGMSASGAPMLSGTFDLHVEFARRLSEFKLQEDCLLFSSGLGGNLGAMQGILRKGDVLILDEKCHKSLVDGGTLSGAKMKVFDHNDMSSLEMQLESSAGKRTLVAIEGVYSMDGDLAKLPEVVELCEHYHAGIYLDEAHSTLLFGKNGRGVAEHFEMDDKIGVTFGTLSKAFGGVGGFICSNERIIRYLKGYSSPWNFSCAPSPPVVGGLMKALEVATRDSTLRDKLWKNVDYLTTHLRALGLDIGKTESQVIPVIIGSSGELLMKLAADIQRRGLFLQPVDFPAVPAHTRRFRISATAGLSKEKMDTALGIIEDVIVKALRTEGSLKR